MGKLAGRNQWGCVCCSRKHRALWRVAAGQRGLWINRGNFMLCLDLEKKHVWAGLWLKTDMFRCMMKPYYKNVKGSMDRVIAKFEVVHEGQSDETTPWFLFPRLRQTKYLTPNMYSEDPGKRLRGICPRCVTQAGTVSDMGLCCGPLAGFLVVQKYFEFIWPVVQRWWHLKWNMTNIKLQKLK